MNRADRALRGAACLALLLAPSLASAQPSTDRLARQATWSTSIAGGTEILKLGGSYSGRVLGLSIARRLALTGSAAGLSGNAFVLRRDLDVVLDGPPQHIAHEVIGFSLAVDADIPLSPELSVVPQAGLGLAPYVHASGRQYLSDLFQPLASGKIWTLGFEVRVKRFLVRQHFIGLLGAENTIYEFREYYPLMVGWRF